MLRQWWQSSFGRPQMSAKDRLELEASREEVLHQLRRSRVTNVEAARQSIRDTYHARAVLDHVGSSLKLLDRLEEGRNKPGEVVEK
jgi:hypothetical protein